MRGWPDWLFQADAKSLAGALLQWRQFTASDTQAATTVNANLNITIETDRIFLLEHMSIRAIGGGAQNVSRVYGYHQDASGNVFQNFGFGVFAPAAVIAFSNWGHYLFPASNAPVLTLTADFSAGAVANVVVASCSGWVLPRGNINL
jgi:hypothetical protein